MNFEEAIDKLYFAETGRHLNEPELIVLRGTFARKTYEEMETSQYSANYLKGDIGPKLWKTLSQAIGEDIGKKNCKAVLGQKLQLKLDEVMPPQKTILSYDSLEVVNQVTSANKPDNQVSKKKLSSHGSMSGESILLKH